MGARISVRTGPVCTDRPRDAQIVDRSAIPDRRIIEANRARYAVAELRSVLDVIEAGVGVIAAQQVRADVARKTVPRSRVGRRGLTEGEAGKLDEGIFNRDVTTTRGVKERSVDAAAREGSCGGLARVVARAVVVELEVALTEGTDNAVFRCGAGINSQRQTGAGDEVVAIPVILAEVAAPGRRPVNA